MKKSILSQMMLLSFPVGFTCLLLAFRIFYSGSLYYLFLPWNMFLAWLPVLFSSYILVVKSKASQLFILLSWLLFFPNSIYIITDLLHLRERFPIPYWYDIVLIFSAALNGLIFAYLSMVRIEQFFRKKFNQKTSIILVCVCLFLSSFGVYLGRYVRLNSWNVVTNPTGLSLEIIDRFIYPFDHSRTWSMTIVLTLFSGIFYFIVKRISESDMQKGGAEP